MNRVEHRASFGGWQDVYEHHSQSLSCTMRVAVYLPPQAASQKLPVVYWLSGLTCNEQNFITKAGAQAYAAKYGLILVAPDTSPRGDAVADDEAYDLGQGAGFYLNATQQPWSTHYQMYSYITDELRTWVEQHFPCNGQASIMGHSMGGHGALMIALKNPSCYQSVSAFAPIVAPCQVPWGQKALTAYLGADPSKWVQWDSVHLMANLAPTDFTPMLVDQGSADDFLHDQLRPELLLEVAQARDYPLQLRRQEGYDHSYYFIASFMHEHLAFHAQYLTKE